MEEAKTQKKSIPVWFNLLRNKEQAKVLYDDRNQKGGGPELDVQGRLTAKRDKKNFGSDENVL